MMKTMVIAGANLAGGRAAETLRQEGFDGRIILVGEEPNRPYERPPLSKGYLLGEVKDGEFFLQDESFYAEQNIELMLSTRVTRLEPEVRQITLEGRETGGRERLPYDKLLITTGARPRRLNIPGSELDGICYLRTIAEARAIRDQLQTARRVVIVGMGFIGAEVAAACRQMEREVIALEAGDLPLEGPLGREVAERVEQIHRDHGVDLRANQAVTSFRGDGRIEQVVTESGERIDCDLVVVGVGVEPAVDWLEGCGLKIDRGIVTDELCRTNLPNVYAAGDVAQWWHPGYQKYLHVEHFDNAADQGAAAAKSMLGKGEPYAPVPYFWSDQYDLSLQFIGHNEGFDRVVVRGTVESGSWSAFYLRDGTFVAALSVNRFKDFSAARRILRQGIAVTLEQLADEGFELKTLLR